MWAFRHWSKIISIDTTIRWRKNDVYQRKIVCELIYFDIESYEYRTYSRISRFSYKSICVRVKLKKIFIEKLSKMDQSYYTWKHVISSVYCKIHTAILLDEISGQKLWENGLRGLLLLCTNSHSSITEQKLNSHSFK
jgi:hypothetical protein